MLYSTRNSLKKPEGTDIDFPGAMEDNTDIIDAALAKCNYLGTADPVAGDDADDGYSAGSQWWNVTAHSVFLCEDATEGAAVWRQIFPSLVDDAELASTIHAASSKTPPIDADELGLVDSAAGDCLKKLTWANLKATIKAYTDTLYPLKSLLTTAGDMGYATGASTWARLALGTQGYRLVAGASAPTWAKSEPGISFIFGDGATVVEGQQCGAVIPFACKITSVKIDSREADGTLLSGSATLKIYIHDYDAAIGSEVDSFSLSTASSYTEGSLTHVVAAGKKITCIISSITTCKQVTCSLVLEAT